MKHYTTINKLPHFYLFNREIPILVPPVDHPFNVKIYWTTSLLRASKAT